MKQHFSDIGQKSSQDIDPWVKWNKWNKAKIAPAHYLQSF